MKSKSGAGMIITGRITALLLFLCVIVGAPACSARIQSFDAGRIKSFRDIPGITADEIASVESLLSSRQSFSYGSLLSTDILVLPDGSYAGFTPLFCSLLGDLFGIPFVPEIYEWHALKDGVDTRAVDFTGALNAITDTEHTYFKTTPIADNNLSVFIKDGVMEIVSEYDLKGLKIGFYSGSSTERLTRAAFPRIDFESAAVDTAGEMAEKLLSNEIDAFIFDTADIFKFYEYSHVIMAKTFSHIYIPVSISTANPELEPVISAITKYLMAGGINELDGLYAIGEHEYAAFVFNKLLNDDERAYIAALNLNQEKVPVGLSNSRYPVCFYDIKSKTYQGIAVDVLDAISNLSGIKFQRAHDETALWGTLEGMLKTGEIALISQLIPNEARREYAIWPDTHYFTSRYALLSNLDFPYLNINQVPYQRVGLTAGTAEEAKYRVLFPEHTSYQTFKSADEALVALEKGEIDLFFNLDYTLLYESNYRENAGQKVNILFDSPVEIVPFGLNINEKILCSIIGKAQSVIETDRIVRGWTSRLFDMSKQMAVMRARYLTVLSVFLLGLLATLLLFYVKSLKLTKKVEHARKQAEQSNRAKGTFLAHMSHEVRTPMNVILGISEIQLLDKTLSAEAEEGYRQIYESGNLLLNIINDILDFSKIDADKLEIVTDKYEIPSLINDATQINLLRYDNKPIAFTLQVDADTPHDLIGDELRIRQILNNLLSNAFKYTDSGEITLSVAAEPGQGGETVVLVLQVRDTGQGMRQDQIDRLFDEYSRFNMETNRGISGTGLGMHITKRLIEMMGGKISVESEAGKGSVFTVRLPQIRCGPDICGNEVAEKLQNFSFRSTAISKQMNFIQEYMPYGSVLIVDDVASNLYVAKGMMLPYGMKIETVTSGFEAVEKIKNGNIYDIIFMDHMMPKMDGIKTAKIIREMGYTHPIVALTANALAGQSEMFLRNGFNAYISKPIDMRELNAALNNLVRDKQPPEVIKAARRGTGHKVTVPASELEKKKHISGELAQAVVTDIKNAIAVLEDTFPKINTPNGADMELYTTIVHGMKGALANIGEAELSGYAFRLEQAGDIGDMAVIADETPFFIESLRLITQKFNPEEKNGADGIGGVDGINGAAEVSPADAAFLGDKLREVKAGCDTLKVKAIEAALSDLKQKTWPPEISDAINEISLNLLRGDLKNVVSAAEKTMKVYSGEPGG